ncbi:MAG: hypothetical protein KC593_14210 [Myxococcales bacterium]|nr:hypothetical protein [Myxococcales bacterium]MCB9627310.1 hypothetical protein [Sandaracinaceae bacterium]
MTHVQGRARARTTLDYWPVVINVIENDFDLADMEGVLAANEVALRRGLPFVTIRDCRGLQQQANALQRKRLAQWQDDNWDLIKERCLGVASVMPSPVVRGVMRAIFWMSAPPTREEVVDTVEEAVATVLGWTSEARIELPAAVSAERLVADLLANKL